ncbi:B3 domain-containing protein At4g01580 [Beta vulgaris subsp. vulgaris]|uniref:B3 domain-containing protein At4g01580 n=1 Tax=Beta vulgaris subsp. vulgaris TaxID=3555 RepID=UPI0025486E32|nr:B3 domain-containing protein At4g01580 [Beta vulgaris subsp. vulgaris]
MTSNGLMKIQKTQAATNGEDTIHFFKIIVAPLTQKFKLRIPRAFVKKYGRHLSSDIYLNVPNSEQPWKVKLEKTNNDIFLGEGWQDVMEFYNVKWGHFLLFRFDGGSISQFDVDIFDLSATEIDYPLRKISCAMKRKSNVKTTVNLASSDFDNVKFSSYKSQDDVVQQSFHNFQSENPHFKVPIRSWNLAKLGLTIPLEYARAYLEGKHKQKIFIIGSGDEKRCYKLTLYVYLHNCHKVKAEIFGRSEMRKFYRDNNLKLGDGCVFELLHPQNNIYKFTIFRAPCLVKH